MIYLGRIRVMNKQKKKKKKKQWRLVASTHFAHRPGLSHEKVDAPKEINKGKKQRKRTPSPYSPPVDAMKSGVGRNSGSPPPGVLLLGPRPLLLQPEGKYADAVARSRQVGQDL